MFKKRSFVVSICLASFISAIIALSLFSPAEAYTYKYGANSTLDKIMYKNALTSTMAFNWDLTIGDLKTYYESNYIPINKDSSCTIPIPNTLLSGDDRSSPVLSCYKFVTGKDVNDSDKKYSWSGVMPQPDLNSESTEQQFSEYLEQIGYNKESDSNGITKNCVHITVTNRNRVDGNGNPLNSEMDNYICSEVYDGTIGSIEIIDTGNNTGYQFFAESFHPEYKITIGRNNNGSGPLTVPVTLNPGSTLWTSFYAEVRDALNGYASTTTGTDDDTQFSVWRTITRSEDEDMGGTEFKINSQPRLAKSVIGANSEDGITSALSTAEVYNIYAQYLKGDAVKLSCGDSDYSDSVYNWMPVKIKRNDKIDDTCYVREINELKYTGGQSVPSADVAHVGGRFYFTRRDMSLGDIIEQINSFDLESIIDDLVNIEDAEAMEEDNEDESKTTEIDCLTSGAAKNLGWIICPILSFASEVSGSMYTNFVEPALKVDPRLFDDHGSDYDVYGAWSTFQGFANVVFIIFFLFVIFSQVTGVGIDNYGIKKIMPKLIITAILINLSYFICLIFVDLSNILGNGITGLFSELSENLGMSTSIANNDGGSIVVSIGSTMLTGVALFGAGYLAFVTAPMWILPLIVAAIGLLISVIFLFILLSVREAAIVIFTVISPLAFICYMLPNTKPLFDRYVKISKVLLLLYPICGLMVAGGGYVSKLLLSVGIADQGLFSTFAAMIISIVPVFFIPKVVKSSLSALGSIGATLSSFGDRMRGRATSGIRNGGAYKGGQERLREFQTRRRAGIDSNGRPLDFNNMTFRQRLARGILTRRGFARNRAQYNKDQSTRDAEGLLLDDNYMTNMAAHRDAALSNEREKMYGEVYDRETDRRIVEAELTSALSGEDAERASAALNALIKKGGISEAFTALRAAPWNSMSANVRNRLIQTMGNSGIDAMSAFSKYRSGGGTGTFDEWANGTASDKSTAKYGSYANYLNEKGANAADNYGKDEMQFLKGLQSSLAGAGGMGASSFGRMLGNAGINSKDAQVRKEAYDMIKSQIGNGTITAGDLGLSSSKVASMNNEMSEALKNGYSDYIASRNPSLSRSQAEAHAEAAIKSAFKQQIQDIKADNTGRLLSGMESGTRNLLGL